MVDIQEIKNNIEKLKNNIPSLNIDSLYIEQNGIIDKLEYKNSKSHELRSCAKVLVAMAIGIAIDKQYKIDDKMLTLDTLIYPTIKSIVNIKSKNNLEKVKKWNIRNLLTHTTGYESQMMSERFIKDIDKNELLDYALNYDIPYEVGNRFAYNNVEPFVLSVFFQEAFNMNLSEFINENIFKKLDIVNYEWENYGKYCSAATGLYMNHSDFHKIGKLLLNDGKYNNIQVISKNWINEMCKLQLETPSICKKERVFYKIGIGYYTFISRDGYVFRDGSNGQYIIVNKEKGILITIMSSEDNMKNITEIFRNII